MSLLSRSPATLLIPSANLILRFQSRNAHEPPHTLTLANSPSGKGLEYTMSRSATWDRIGAVLDLVTPDEARAYFRAAGYDPD